MVKPENINSRNIKYFEIKDHNGDIDTYFKSSNKWYKVSHVLGYINNIEKASFKQIDSMISTMQRSPKHYRIFEPDEYHNHFKTPTPSKEHIFYDTKMGNTKFYYGEDGEIEVTARQIVQNYDKIRRKI